MGPLFGMVFGKGILSATFKTIVYQDICEPRLYALKLHDQQQLTEFSHSYRQIGLSLLFFRTQNSPSRRWRRGRHPSQRWTRLIDSEPNKHMLRWNIFWWCFLLLGLQNVFTPIRYYQLRRRPFEGNETVMYWLR